MEIIPLEKNKIIEVQELAQKIWWDNYQEMISAKQIEYMLNWMYDEKTIENDIENGEFWYFLKHDNSSIGYCHFYPKNEQLFLSKLYLEKAVHGKGFAKNTLDFIVNKARDLGKKSIQLTVNKNNHRAIGFYEKHEFNRIKEEVFDIGNGYIMDDFIYELSII